MSCRRVTTKWRRQWAWAEGWKVQRLPPATAGAGTLCRHPLRCLLEKLPEEHPPVEGPYGQALAHTFASFRRAYFAWVCHCRAVLKRGKKNCSGTWFFQKGPRVAHMFNHDWWRLAVGGWWRLPVGGWRLVVGGGWQLVMGGWWRLAGVDGWRLVAVGGWWQLAVSSWWSLEAVIKGGP